MDKGNTPSFFQVNVSIDGEVWNKVDSFEKYAPEDPVFVLDSNTGAVLFGDGKHGRKPPAGSRIAATYRTGGGSVGNILSFTWTVADPHINRALSATITTLPDSFRLNIYQGNEQSWRWKFIAWLCDALKGRLLDSPIGRR
jgi:hypothetical protein